MLTYFTVRVRVSCEFHSDDFGYRNLGERLILFDNFLIKPSN